MVKKKACIFISGSGTNLRSIIKSSREYNFPINIRLIVSNNKNAKGIIFAKKFSIPYICLKTNRYNFEKIVLKKLIDKKIQDKGQRRADKERTAELSIAFQSI